MIKKGGLIQNKSARKVLQEVIDDFNMQDLWRIKNPSKKEYTWSRPKQKIFCRLDMIFGTRLIENSCLNSKIFNTIQSDHKGVSVSLNLKQEKRGPGFYKFNSSLLKDIEYKNNIRNLINSKWEEHSNITDLRVRYDLLKYFIVDYSIAFSKQKAKTTRKEQSTLLKTLEKLDKKIVANTISEEELKQFSENKSRLEFIYKQKAEGERLRAKIDNIELDEKSTSFFHRKAKVVYEKKTINKLKLENGQIVQDSTKILHELGKFYQNLYGTDNKKDTKHTPFQNITSLTTEDQSKCEGDLTESECLKSLN